MTLAQAVVSFTLLAVVVTVTPGLDTVLVLRQALRGGRRTAFAAAAGICLGALLWGIAAAAGVAALFVASEVAYAVLRWAGIAFLAYLAWTYLRSALKPGPPIGGVSTSSTSGVGGAVSGIGEVDSGAGGAALRGSPHADLTAGSVDTPREAFVKGLLTDLLNPKMAVFYLTVLPLFLPAGLPPVGVGALLAGLHAAVAFAWFTVIVLCAHAVRGFLTSRRGARVIDGAAGVAMLGFGVVLGVER